MSRVFIYMVDSTVSIPFTFHCFHSITARVSPGQEKPFVTVFVESCGCMQGVIEFSGS